MTTEPEAWVTCAWCRRTLPLTEAIDEGWWPDWWDGDTCHDSSACPTCAANHHLQQDGDGEMGLRTGHPLPEDEQRMDLENAVRQGNPPEHVAEILRQFHEANRDKPRGFVDAMTELVCSGSIVLYLDNGILTAKRPELLN
jgi:hypothetical protein